MVVSYVHNAAAPGLGKIGVLVALESGADAARSRRSASSSPCTSPRPTRWRCAARSSIRRWSSASARSPREKAAESGKPAEIVEKMVEGAMAKFRKENALLSPALRHGQQDQGRGRRRRRGKEAGAPIVLKAYVRFQLGEGIEKKESDFAAEVAAAAGAKPGSRGQR